MRGHKGKSMKIKNCNCDGRSVCSDCPRECSACGETGELRGVADESVDDIMPGVIIMNAHMTHCIKCGRHAVVIPKMTALIEAATRPGRYRFIDGDWFALA
jgi:hypothetical protein